MARYDDLISARAKTVAYWPLDDLAGNARDVKAANPATTIGSGIARQQPGPVRNALGYKGDNTANARISVPHAAALNGPGSALELEFWVKFTGDAAQYFEKLGTHSYRLQIQASGLVVPILTTSGGTFFPASAAGALRSGEWALINVSWSANVLNTYVNSVLVSTGATSGTLTNNTAALELFSQTAGQYVNETALRFAIYNAALTDAERLESYKVGLYELPRAPRRRPRRQLSWALCDSHGAVVTELSQRTDGQVEVELNGARRASVEVSLEEKAAAKAKAFASRLKVWLAGEPILNGALINPQWKADGRTVELAAIDQSEQLANAFTKGIAKQAQVDQSEILWQLIKHVNDAGAFWGAVPAGGTGIIAGSLPPSYLRDRFFPDGANVWDEIVALSEITNGVDFELQPLDRTDGTYAQLNTFFPWQGNDRTADVVLAYNTQEANAVDFTHEPGGGELVNFAIFSGQAQEGAPAPAWIAWHTASIAANGIWQHFESLPDVKYTAQLREAAETLVATRAQPVDFFDVVPAVEAGGSALGYYRDANGLWRQDGRAYSVPPRFGPPASGGEYWIGDEITAIARDHGMRRQLVGRVTFARLSEVGDDAGQLAVEISCAPRIDAAGVSGVSTTVSTEDFS